MNVWRNEVFTTGLVAAMCRTTARTARIREAA